MKTLLEIIQLSAEFLKKSGIQKPRREAEEVIADVLDLRRIDLYLQFERPLSEKELQGLRDSIKRRAAREPVSYISGKVQFAGIEFLVSPKVLIPRPETEILVEKITLALKQTERSGKVLWDMCCGSGCMGISLKKRFPNLEVVCSDISADALSIAKENAVRAAVDITFEQGNLFEPFLNQSCDFFVCNPPYVSEKEYATLSPEIFFEPKEALIAGKTGFEFYALIAQNLKPFLRPGGKGWLEIGSRQGNSVKKMFESHLWTCHFEPDWAGHDRFFFLEGE